MLRFRAVILALALLSYLQVPSLSLADDWAQWRGPNRDGISAETGLLQSWPEGGLPRAWLFEECGLGYGGPSIVGDRLYIMGTRDEKEVLFALDANSGKEKWFTPVGEIYSERHGDGPRCTPAVDGDLVYALGAKGNLVCVEAATGHVVWTKSLEADLGGRMPNWGYCESPLIYKETILCTPGGSKGAIAALNKKTGEVVWQATDITAGAHYTSIVPMPHDGREDAVQLFGDQLVGFDLANGKLLWTVPFARTIAAIATPVVSGKYAYATSGYGAGCLLVEVSPESQGTKVYENKIMKNKQGCVILLNGHIFGHSEGAGWVCQDFLTGEQTWRERDALEMGAIAYADNRFYCLGQDTGDVALVEPSTEKWIEHGRFKLDPQSKQRSEAGKVWTIPVIANGRLFLRDQNIVACYDVHASSIAQAGGAQEK